MFCRSFVFISSVYKTVLCVSVKVVSDYSCDIISQEAVLKEMERKHLCEVLVMERLISEEKESDLRKATQQLSKEQQQERLFELKVCTINLCYALVLYCGFRKKQ